MPGATKIVIINKNEEIKSFISYAGDENIMFFSEDFINGNIDLAIKKLIKSSLDFQVNNNTNNQLLAPINYGMSVLDFKRKKIFSLTNFDSPGLLNLSRYSIVLKNALNMESQKHYKTITENEKIKFFNIKTNQKSSVIDFCGSQKSEEVLNFLLKKEKELKNETHFVIPHNLDFEIKNYEFEQASKFFIETFSFLNYKIEDINEWDNYLKSMPHSKKEKKYLDKSIRESNIIKRQKL
jgi:hypothetical protein